MTKKTLEVACPTCKKKIVWSEENKDRPFCSPRCKMIDLGEWADENHAIAGDPYLPNFDDGHEEP